MTFGEIITYIMLVFAIFGCIDKAFGSKLKIGSWFEKALMSTGTLILAMVGPMALAPFLSNILAPVISPVCAVLKIDPSVTAGLLLPVDAGGWALATSLANDEALGKFSGAIIGSMMGATITGSLPVCFMLCPKEKIPVMAKGLSLGFIAVPIGCFFGGIFMGIHVGSLLINMLPLILMSALLVLGLRFFERVTIKIVSGFGYVITALVTLALGFTMILKVLNIESDKIESFDNCLKIIGGIVIFLCGAFVLLDIVQRVFKKPLKKLGQKIGLDEFSIIGALTCAINIIPMFSVSGKMSDRGFVICSAFMVCGAFLFGDHLAFQTTVDPQTALPMVLGKLLGGVFAVLLAFLTTRPKKSGN